MAKALGIGGIFFKSDNPKQLAQWYKRWLDVPLMEGYEFASFLPDTMPANSCGVWSPFKADTDYFAPSDQTFMFNLIVDDLDGALAQVVEGGAKLAGDIDEQDYGRFGWFIDPDGNKVELWQPATAS
ncbi:MAG: VOC family protein [Porticoccaceae bacterium]|nr:VOC family protein [Porticoccaceae bacterium]